MKMRKLELRAGAAKAHGKAGPGRDCLIKELRHRKMELVANAENAYAGTLKRLFSSSPLIGGR
jgi:transposase